MRRLQGSSSESEEESEEEEVGDEEGEGEEDVEMAEGGQIMEGGDAMEFEIPGGNLSRAPSPHISPRSPSSASNQPSPLPRVSPTISHHSHPPSLPQTHHSISHTIPLTTSRHSISHTIPLTTSHHHSSQRTVSIPTPQHDPPYDRAYIDQRFDALLEGQQAILQSMESMRLYHEQQYKVLNDKVDELYADNTALLRFTRQTRVQVHDLWDHTFPDRVPFRFTDYPISPPWHAAGPSGPQGAGNDNDPQAHAPTGAQGGGPTDQPWGEHSGDSFHPPEDWLP